MNRVASVISLFMTLLIDIDNPFVMRTFLGRIIRIKYPCKYIGRVVSFPMRASFVLGHNIVQY